MDVFNTNLQRRRKKIIRMDDQDMLRWQDELINFIGCTQVVMSTSNTAVIKSVEEALDALERTPYYKGYVKKEINATRKSIKEHYYNLKNNTTLRVSEHREELAALSTAAQLLRHSEYAYKVMMRDGKERLNRDFTEELKGFLPDSVVFHLDNVSRELGKIVFGKDQDMEFLDKGHRIENAYRAYKIEYMKLIRECNAVDEAVRERPELMTEERFAEYCETYDTVAAEQARLKNRTYDDILAEKKAEKEAQRKAEERAMIKQLKRQCS